MMAVEEHDRCRPVATDGEIAAINLQSERRGAWARFAREVPSPGLVEAVVDKERLVLQFFGDLEAIDRLEGLAAQFGASNDSFRVPLVQAEVAALMHHFDDALVHLARAAQMGGPSDAIERQSLTVDQACGRRLHDVLAARRQIACATDRPEDLVPLGAVLADLECFEEADAIYRRAFYSYDGNSPFLVAWISFQLGVLWGELVPTPEPNLAAFWYRSAIDYLPSYVRARVHLAEVYANQDRTADAEALLAPALASGDPEVQWRLADVLIAQHRFEDASFQIDAARSGFEALLRRHLLAFADHAAEFYAASGGDLRRALELARANVANRPTRLAIKQTQAIAARLAAQGA
jgi:hypothetical protein